MEEYDSIMFCQVCVHMEKSSMHTYRSGCFNDIMKNSMCWSWSPSEYMSSRGGARNQIMANMESECS